MPAFPVSVFARALPMSRSFSEPPLAFSNVLSAPRIRLRLAFTTCVVARPRLTVTPSVVLVEKSSVSTPPADSSSVSVPSAVAVLNRKLSLPEPPTRVSSPASPCSVSRPAAPSSRLARLFPVSTSFNAPPRTFSNVSAAFSVSVRLLAVTVWGVVRPRLTATVLPVVCEKSSVSRPAPASSVSASLPSTRSASSR